MTDRGILGELRKKVSIGRRFNPTELFDSDDCSAGGLVPVLCSVDITDDVGVGGT